MDILIVTLISLVRTNGLAVYLILLSVGQQSPSSKEEKKMQLICSNYDDKKVYEDVRRLRS